MKIDHKSFEILDIFGHKIVKMFRSNVMDIYLLARVFRTFSNNYNSKYILIYTGNNHSKVYRDVLKLLKFKLVNEVYNDNQCLDISRFNWPFFGKP